MNIYKTKGETYINMNQVHYIDVFHEDEPVELEVHIYFSNKHKVVLWDKEEARAFLEYLDNHLVGVYAGSA